MKVLITGGSGLVGYAINSVYQNYNKQYNKSHDFIFLGSRDADLRDYTQTRAIFAKHMPDAIIHLAAKVGGLFMNMNNKVQMFEDNLMINYNVLRAAHDLNINNVISCLSTCIFPDNTTYPIDETMLHNGAPHDSNDSYAYCKRMAEVHSKAYREQYNRNYFCVIPTNIYGPNDNYNLDDAHVIPALVHRCYICKQQGQPFVVKGSGKPLRQFIHSYDLAYLMLYVLDNYHDGTPIILAPDEADEMTIADVANNIAKCFDYVHMMQFDNTSADGQYKKTANNAKLRKLLPNYAMIPFNDGINESINWFEQNYTTLRK